MTSGASGYLAVSKPLWQLDAGGKMVIPVGLKHFSLDVGVNKGMATRRWLEMDPNALVIGVEANTLLVMMLTEIEKPGQPTSYVGWLQSNTSAHAKISVQVREMKAPPWRSRRIRIAHSSSMQRRAAAAVRETSTPAVSKTTRARFSAVVAPAPPPVRCRWSRSSTSCSMSRCTCVGTSSRLMSRQGQSLELFEEEVPSTGIFSLYV